MKLIIEIPEEIYESQRYAQYFGAWSVVLQKHFENGVQLEQEPKTGRWYYDEERGATGIYAICSNCEENIYQTGDFKYCPNCGAKME